MESWQDCEIDAHPPEPASQLVRAAAHAYDVGGHISSLQEAIRAWNATNPYELVEEDRSDQHVVRWRIQIGNAPTPQLGLIVGEAVHGMRAALDNLFWAFAVRHRDPPTTPSRVQFPIWKDLTGNASWLSTGIKMLEHVSAEVGAVVTSLQPCIHSPDAPHIDKLWVLNRIWNDDKHRTIVPVVTSVTEPKLTVRYREGPVHGVLGTPYWPAALAPID